MSFSLKKVVQYASKVFGLSDRFSNLSDDRKRRSVPLFNAVMMVFAMFVCRYDSLNAFIKDPSPFMQLRRQNIAKGRIPGRDALTGMMAGLHVNELKAILIAISQKLKRNGTTQKNAIDGVRALAVDGTENFSSDTKQFPGGLHRTHKNGRTDCYVKSVVAMFVGPLINVVAGFTMLHPRDGESKQEGELTGAKRLLQELYDALGRFADVIVADALYLNAPFINFVRSLHMHVVIRLKDKTRTIYRTAERLFDQHMYYAGMFVRDDRIIEVYDVSGLPMTGVNGTVRVLRFTIKKIKGTDITDTEPDQVMWVLTTSTRLRPTTIYKIMRSRWNEENNGFNELKNLYHLNHNFSTECLEQMFALGLIAYNMFECYVRLQRARDTKSAPRRIDSKPNVRTKKSIAKEMDDSLLFEAVWATS